MRAKVIGHVSSPFPRMFRELVSIIGKIDGWEGAYCGPENWGRYGAAGPAPPHPWSPGACLSFRVVLRYFLKVLLGQEMFHQILLGENMLRVGRMQCG